MQQQDRATVIEVARASGLFPSEQIAQIEATADDFLPGAAQADT